MAYFLIAGIREGDELIDIRGNQVMRYRVEGQCWAEGSYTITCALGLPYGHLDPTRLMSFSSDTDPAALRASAEQMLAVADHLDHSAEPR